MCGHSGKLHAHACNRVRKAWGEVTFGTCVRRSDPRCCNRECLLFGATSAFRGFTPDFGDASGCWAGPWGSQQEPAEPRHLARLRCWEQLVMVRQREAFAACWCPKPWCRRLLSWRCGPWVHGNPQAALRAGAGAGPRCTACLPVPAATSAAPCPGAGPVDVTPATPLRGAAAVGWLGRKPLRPGGFGPVPAWGRADRGCHRPRCRGW